MTIENIQKKGGTAMNHYYYSKLNKEGQAAYHAIKTGLQSLAPSFQVPRLDGKELSDIYFMLRLDCPEIFYTVKFKYRYFPESGNAQMFPSTFLRKRRFRTTRKP